MGEEVGALGGVFTVTQGLVERYGEDRVMDSPIAENGLVGWAVGAATEGMRPVVEIMFSDFALLALDQIINMAAKIRFMSNGQFSVPIVIRMPGGGGTNHGPQHSQSLESLFAQVPGLVVAMPSTASDAYWMMREAIALDDPVIFLENKYLYFRNIEEVDEHEGPRGFGARVARAGTDLTVVSSGRMTHRCIEAAEAMAADGIEAEVVDMRYIWPLDTDTVGTLGGEDEQAGGGLRGRRVLGLGRRGRGLGGPAPLRRPGRADRAPGLGALADPVPAPPGGPDRPDHRAHRSGPARPGRILRGRECHE